LSFFSSLLDVVCTSDSLETILSHLSITVMKGIADRSCLHHLNYLLEFLAAWEKRPAYLTPMAYQWCSAISEAAGRHDPNETTINPSSTQGYILQWQIRLRPHDQIRFWSYSAENGFSEVGPSRDPVRLDFTSRHSRGRPQHLTPPMYAHLLFITFEIGFCRDKPGRDQSVLRLDHTSHHKWVFETILSSDDDEVIADALCIWTVGDGNTPPGSCARYLVERVERAAPFSPRLRQASIRAIERTRHNELKVSGLDTIRWLNCLDVDVDDIVEEETWAELLVVAMRSPTGPESISSHYWHLVDKLVVASRLQLILAPRDTEIMRSLEKAEDWEKLGAWMVIVWSFLSESEIPTSESMEGIEQVTLRLLLRRPSALPTFEDLCWAGCPCSGCRACKDKLHRICKQVRSEQLPS